MHPSLTVLPITRHLVEVPLLRVGIGAQSGLQLLSQIQIDKPQPPPRRERIGPVIGCVDRATLAAVNRGLAGLV